MTTRKALNYPGINFYEWYYTTQACFQAGGDVWVKEGGSSDLTADVVRQIQSELPGVDTKQRIHVVQHGNFNEWLTCCERCGTRGERPTSG